jgi:uncharacterized protein YjiS (DUF1127 family)
MIGSYVGDVVRRWTFPLHPRRILVVVANWHRRNCDAAHLASLDDDRLRDIGISRDEIPLVLRGRRLHDGKRPS